MSDFSEQLEQAKNKIEKMEEITYTQAITNIDDFRRLVCEKYGYNWEEIMKRFKGQQK